MRGAWSAGWQGREAAMERDTCSWSLGYGQCFHGACFFCGGLRNCCSGSCWQSRPQIAEQQRSRAWSWLWRQDDARSSFPRHQGMTSAQLLGGLNLSHFSCSFTWFSARVVIVTASFQTRFSPHFWRSLQKNTTFPLIIAWKTYSKVWKLWGICFVISTASGIRTFSLFSYLKTGLF